MRNLPKSINRRVGRAMHTYRMLADGDRVLIAVSGGVDSLLLAWLLHGWRRKAPIAYEMEAVHIDNGFDDSGGGPVAEQLDRLRVPYRIERTDFGSRAMAAENGKSVCFHCSRQRRNRLFSLARLGSFSKIAYGHHRDDIIETFFLNLFYGGNLSTMIPRQDVFGGELALIRPFAFLEKHDIQRVAASLGIRPVKNPCPMDCDSKRHEVRSLLADVHDSDPAIKANIFAALGNVREEYLLGPG